MPGRTEGKRRRILSTLALIAALAAIAGPARADHAAPSEERLFALATTVVVGVVASAPDERGAMTVRVERSLIGSAGDGAPLTLHPADTRLCACDGRVPEFTKGQRWLLFLVAGREANRLTFVTCASNAWLRLDDEAGEAATRLDALVAIARHGDLEKHADVVDAAKEGHHRLDAYISGSARWQAAGAPRRDRW